jgi:hypothetical protein
MSGQKSIVGLGLLCALMFSAFAAQSAIAAKGTTGFTCKPGTPSVGFSDEHCDTAAVSPAAKFEHVDIAPGTKTDVEGTNAKTASSTTASTPALLVIKGLFGIAEVKITCTTGSTGPVTSYFENKETTPMSAEGTVDLTLTGCTQVGLGVKCGVTSLDDANKELVAGTITAGGIGQSKVIKEAPEEMGVEFGPDNVEGNFTTLVFTGEGCAFKGQKVPVKGSVISTSGGGINGAGATFVVTPAMSSLTVGGHPTTLSATCTARMTEGGNPIVLTTTAS